MQPQSYQRKLILASSSPYRKALLERLHLPFETTAPAVDERPLPGELPAALVARLAARKAEVVAARNPAAVVIGSDQLALHRGCILGKPGTVARAREQLAAFSGETVEFLTAVSVQCLETGLRHERTVATEVAFRTLTVAEIDRYVALDRPLDCAGAFRSESAGATLLRHLRSDDPSAIVGLPLIAVSAALREAGFALP
jgi:septum formation protein